MPATLTTQQRKEKKFDSAALRCKHFLPIDEWVILYLRLVPENYAKYDLTKRETYLDEFEGNGNDAYYEYCENFTLKSVGALSHCPERYEKITLAYYYSGTEGWTD